MYKYEYKNKDGRKVRVGNFPRDFFSSDKESNPYSYYIMYTYYSVNYSYMSTHWFFVQDNPIFFFFLITNLLKFLFLQLTLMYNLHNNNIMSIIMRIILLSIAFIFKTFYECTYESDTNMFFTYGIPPLYCRSLNIF